ncbi:Hypothetical predicted protein [Mytilus galloprovincialis]|uniref:COL6A n=2 Tax=Mytilus galloprovincialis TaxID=29158 RepID=A0A8B6F470_MYTGA|nr:Hypothetical predicted protein [Mytilus galloprovincialis]
MMLVWILLPLLFLRRIAAEVCSNQPADIGFLIDESGSVGGANFKKNLDFVKQFVDVFDVGNSAVKISTFAFHTSMGNGFHFSCCNDKASIKSNVDNISYNGGGENFEMALAFAKNNMFQRVNGARDFSLKILIFFTDGQSAVKDGGNSLHQLGVIVYAVGVGGNVDRNQLDKIATNQSYVFMASSYADLVGQVYRDIKSKTCTDVLTNPCERSPQPCQNQGTCISTGGSKYTCLCPNGFTDHNCQTDIDDCAGVMCYNGGTCIDGLASFTCSCAEHYTGTHCGIDMCKPYPTDVVFVIDSSNSCSEKYFNITKNFIKSVTKEWEITVNNFQVAIVSYADNSYIELNFDNSMNKISFDAFVSQMNPRGGISEIHKGINHAVNILNNRNRVVSSSQVKKYIIVLSDGLPSTPSMISTVSGHQIETFAVAVGEDVSHHFLSVITGGSEKIFPYNNDRLWHYMMDALIDQSCNICQRSEETDVVFAVDTSNGWQSLDLTTKVPTIINKILSGLKLGPMNTQIALLTYASSSNIRFDFNKYTNETERQNLQRQLSSFVKTTHTNTNITAMIHSADVLLFDGVKGARSSAKKFLVVFSNYQNDVTIEDSELIETLKENVEIFVVGLDQSDEQFKVMLDIASTSFHIGIDGEMSVNSIDTYIPSLLEQIYSVHCDLR